MLVIEVSSACHLPAGQVGESVQLDLGEEASVLKSTVGGSIQLDQNAGSIFVLESQIDSDLQLFQNRAGATIADNRVGGNIQLESNLGQLLIDRNIADGDLQCKQNDPPPTGTGNQASSKEDQCRAL